MAFFPDGIEDCNSERISRMKEENLDSDFDLSEFPRINIEEETFENIEVKKEPGEECDAIGTFAIDQLEGSYIWHTKSEYLSDLEGQIDYDNAMNTTRLIDSNSLDKMVKRDEIKDEPKYLVTSESVDQYRIVKVRLEDGKYLFECRVCRKRHAKRGRVSTWMFTSHSNTLHGFAFSNIHLQ